MLDICRFRIVNPINLVVDPGLHFWNFDNIIGNLEPLKFRYYSRRLDVLVEVDQLFGRTLSRCRSLRGISDVNKCELSTMSVSTIWLKKGIPLLTYICEVSAEKRKAWGYMASQSCAEYGVVLRDINHRT
jgi:hypothetical protein